MNEFFILAGSALIAVGILTPVKKETTLDPDDAGIKPNEQDDPRPIIDDDSGESGSVDPV